MLQVLSQRTGLILHIDKLSGSGVDIIWHLMSSESYRTSLLTRDHLYGFFCQVTDSYLLNKSNKIPIYRCTLKIRSSVAYVHVNLKQIKAPNLVKIIITFWFLLPLYYLFRRPTIKMYSPVSCIWWLRAVHKLIEANLLACVNGNIAITFFSLSAT